MRRTILLSGVCAFITAFFGGLLAFSLVVPQIVDAQVTRIRAEDIVVVDESGTNRVRLSTGPGTRSELRVLSQTGVPRVAISTGGDPAFGSIESDAAYVRVFAPEGPLGAGGLAPIASFGTTADGAGTEMRLRDRNNQIRLRLLVDSDGNPSIEMMDPDGNVTWSAQ
jgi:hypothetical protein